MQLAADGAEREQRTTAENARNAVSGIAASKLAALADVPERQLYYFMNRQSHSFTMACSLLSFTSSAHGATKVAELKHLYRNQD